MTNSRNAWGHHDCGQCKKSFFPAVYWFDSIHAANYEKRIIIPFCSPKCVQEWYEKNNAISFPLRKPPFPKGPEWKVIYDINH
jgi:hypothetical protein